MRRAGLESFVSRLSLLGSTMRLFNSIREQWNEAGEAGKELWIFARTHNWKRSGRNSLRKKYWGESRVEDMKSKRSLPSSLQSTGPCCSL